MNSLTVTSITPLEKRPVHPNHAAARGLSENYETVFVIKGASDGPIYSPIIWRGRYFHSFTKHDSEEWDGRLLIVQVIFDNPKNPFNGSSVAEYQNGILAVYENVSRDPRRPVIGRKNNKLVFDPRRLELVTIEPRSGIETKKVLENALSWRCGTGDIQVRSSNPFSHKAIELTAKEIEAHTNQAKRHERIAL